MASSSGQDSLRQGLLTAAFWGDIELFKLVAKELDNGEGIEKVVNDVSDPEGKKVLHYAVLGEGRIPMCRYLVEELKLDVNVLGAKGETPLHACCVAGDFFTSAYLLDHGANPNVVMEGGITPLHFAAKEGHTDLLCLLIKRGATVDAQTVLGTPLQLASAGGVKESVEILLKNHANPNLVCPHWLPPLIVAIHGRSIDCVRLLLKWGADPNVTSWGMIPLVEAVLIGEIEMILCLLTAGADPDKLDFYDLKPIELAAIKRNVNAIMALYPGTTKIEHFHDWSVRGILEYVTSDEYKNMIKLRREEKFWVAKANGAEAINRRHYMEAKHWYTEAMSAKPRDAELWAKRSLCWLRMKDGKRALHDALACIVLRDDWPMAHYRAGMAWLLLQDYGSAAEAFRMAARLDSEKRELQQASREAELDFQAVLMHLQSTR